MKNPVSPQPVVASQTETNNTEDLPPAYLPGIDLEDGLKRMRGRWPSYKRLLLLFYNDYNNSTEQLASLLDAGDFGEAELLAHSLNGISASLSAVKFNEQAMLMEQACKNENRTEAEARLGEFHGSLLEVMDGLANLGRP